MIIKVKTLRRSRNARDLNYTVRLPIINGMTSCNYNQMLSEIMPYLMILVAQVYNRVVSLTKKSMRRFLHRS